MLRMWLSALILCTVLVGSLHVQPPLNHSALPNTINSAPNTDPYHSGPIDQGPALPELASEQDLDSDDQEHVPSLLARPARTHFRMIGTVVTKASLLTTAHLPRSKRPPRALSHLLA